MGNVKDGVQEVDENVKSRRSLIHGVLGATGFALLAACRNKNNFDSSVQEGTIVVEEPEVGSNEATIDLQCDVLSKDIIDLDSIESISSGVGPIYKLFGTFDQGMLTFSLANYDNFQFDKVQSVILLRGDGKLLGVRYLTNADFTAAGYLRPLVFDDIKFKGVNHFAFVIRLENGRYYKYQPAPETIAAESTFNNLPVVAIKAGAVDPTHYLNQGFINIGNGIDGFKNSADPQKVFQARPLRTAQSNADFVAGTGLDGCIVTDLVGKIIADDGNVFVNILEHQSIAAYKLSGDGTKYFRTIVRIG